MKISVLFFTFCFSLNSFSQKGDYLIKNNGDTIWGVIKLNQKMFYVDNVDHVEINAADVSKIKSDRYKGNTVVACKLQVYVDNLADLEIDYIKKGSVDTVLILDEIYTTPKINFVLCTK